MAWYDELKQPCKDCLPIDNPVLDDSIPYSGKVSLLINAHNEGADLLNTILSFKAKTLCAFEAIVLADMTTDGSADNLPDYVRVIRNDGPERIGCGEAKHRLLQAATGDFILHVDGHNRIISGTVDQLARLSDLLNCVAIPGLGPMRFTKPHEQATEGDPGNCYYGGALVLSDKGLPDIDQQTRKPNRAIAKTDCVNNSTFGYVRRLATQFGGWHRFPGTWGQQEAGFSWRLWWTDTPIYCLRDTIVLHRYQDWWDGENAGEYRKARTGYSVPPWHRRANRRYATYVTFSKETWDAYWQPHIDRIEPDTDGKAALAMAKSHAEEQRAEFIGLRKRTEAEFFKRFAGVEYNPAHVSLREGATRALWSVGAGMGNVLLGVPAMKALAALSGEPIDLFDHKLHQKDMREFLKAQPFVREVYTKDAPPDMREYALVGQMMAVGLGLMVPNGAKLAVAPHAHKTLHEVDCNMEAVRELGYSGLTPSARVEHKPYTRTPLPDEFVAVGVGSGRGVVHKRYPHWEAVCRTLADSGVHLVFIGRADGRRDNWMSEIGIDLTENTSVTDAAGILSSARMYVGIDNGLSHLAAAVGTPSIVIYGPTSQRKNHPWTDNAHILESDWVCSPCFETAREKRCKGKVNPVPCLAAISPERVASKVLQVLLRPCADSISPKAELMSARQMCINGKVQCLQSRFELAAVMGEIHALAPQLILEIGTNHGGWAAHVSSVCPPGCEIVTVDNIAKPQQEEAGQIVRRHRCAYTQVIADSLTDAGADAIRAAVKGRLVDVLHIDGDHSERAVRHDWETYGPLVRPGGMVIFHDAQCTVRDERVAVEKLWNELKYTYRSMTLIGEADNNGRKLGTGILWIPADTQEA